MTELGFTMNHSSARNYVLRVMKKFVETFCAQCKIKISSIRAYEIAKTPDFQQGIADVLHEIETHRRSSKR